MSTAGRHTHRPHPEECALAHVSKDGRRRYRGHMVRDARRRAPHHEGESAICDKFNTTGKSVLLIFRITSSPENKNISLHNSGNQNYNLAHPGPSEGRFAIVTMRWAGMRWTLWRQACFSRRTKTPRRTAKSCGPGAAMLALSLWSNSQVTVAKKPAHRGEHEVSRKAIAWGKPGCFG